MKISQTLLKGDTFTLEFSITTKDEYTKEFLSNIKEEDKPHSNSKYPIGVRHFIVQEEHYGVDKDYKYKLNPTIVLCEAPNENVEANKDKAPSENAEANKDKAPNEIEEIPKQVDKNNLFYKIDEWKIYYSESTNGFIKLDLFD